MTGGAHQGPLVDGLAMLGCCSPASQYGAEGGVLDCAGPGGHQAPGPSMEEMGGGGTG